MEKWIFSQSSILLNEMLGRVIGRGESKKQQVKHGGLNWILMALAFNMICKAMMDRVCLTRSSDDSAQLS